MREELVVKILNAFAPPDRETMQSMKMQLEIILADYEITERCTELVALNEEKNDVIVKRFIASKLAEGRSTRTLGYYKQTIEAFLAKVNKDFDAITADDIRLYLAVRINRDKVTKTTANNERRNISAFYCWLQTEEIILKNPMKKIAPIKVTKEKKKAFSEMEMELLRDGCKTARERALIEVLASTWCRVSEVAQIRLDEIDKNEILVHGKGDKDRVVYLNAKAQLALTNYLKERKDDNPYLFPKSTMTFSKCDGKGKTNEWYKYKKFVSPDGYLHTSTIEHTVRTIAEHAGVENAHPHRFRRTGATMALRAGMPLTTVSKLLGHSNIGVTQIYLDISDQELEEAHKKYVK